MIKRLIEWSAATVFKDDPVAPVLLDVLTEDDAWLDWSSSMLARAAEAKQRLQACIADHVVGEDQVHELRRPCLTVSPTSVRRTPPQPTRPSEPTQKR